MAKSKAWRQACSALIMMMFCVNIGCSSTKQGRDLLSLKEEELTQKFEDDLRLLRRYDEGLSQTMLYAKAHPELFPKGLLSDQPLSMTPEQRSELQGIWRSVLDYMRAVDGIKSYWRNFHKINAIKRPEDHARAFFIGYAAWMVQYQHGLDFIDMAVPSEPLEVLLDEAAPAAEIPGGAFKELKLNIIQVKAVGRFLGGRLYYKTQRPRLEKAGCKSKPECSWAMEVTQRYIDQTRAQLAQRAAIQFSYNAFDIVRDFSFNAWFPLQSSVAEWMGDTKVKRLHQHLISTEQIQTMQGSLQPGDIIVARHNWYLSNVGLPGFWPHAELYLGTPDELKAHLDLAEVTAALPELEGKPLSEYLAKTFPKAWAEYTSKAEDDHPRRVIEAVSEGVVFSSLEHGAGADYVGVMRPRFDRAATARAVIRAFHYHGRPYDFNFDFQTEEVIVCTELVYKAWLPGQGKAGPKLDLIKVVGRPTLPANDIVRQFAEQEGRPDEERELEFIYFLDGVEKQSKAVIADRKSFIDSWKRPKWDFVQK